MEHSATYSPEDNKLRIYPAYRFDKSDYHRLRSAGFKWAPKQELFVAPMWTPAREDIALEYCGEIGDEDTSLVDRAAERADRFDGYSDKRAQDADNAKDYVKSIADHIPFGQPILVGHHSEKRARKDAERIENGMRKAVKMWETSKYWEMRAAGAIRHAKYKERPDVRARRIKKIEAEKRKQVRNIDDSRKWLNLWLYPSILTMQKARVIANYCHNYEIWSDLDKGNIDHKQARNRHVPMLERSIAHCERWVNHFNNRLTYEKAMLDSQGASDLLKPKKRPKQLPLLNYRAPDGITVENPPYYAEKKTHYEQVEMSKGEYSKVPKDYRGTRKVENSHRIKICVSMYVPSIKAAAAEITDNTARYNRLHRSVAVFLTDSKVHKKPEPIEKEPAAPRLKTQGYIPPKQEPTEFDQMKDTLREGVKAVSAPQLFPTPPDVAVKMVDLAETEPYQTVLEPSAGTGNLLKALLGFTGFKCKNHKWNVTITAIELNQDLVDRLKSTFSATDIRQGDFLECNGDLGTFDRIIMNPPFKNGEDIKHIRHALTFLKPGGRLVALCANGPRQQEQLKPLADTWEDLPQGTFKNQGTMVNSALLTIQN